MSTDGAAADGAVDAAGVALHAATIREAAVRATSTPRDPIRMSLILLSSFAVGFRPKARGEVSIPRPAPDVNVTGMHSCRAADPPRALTQSAWSDVDPRHSVCAQHHGYAAVANLDSVG
jgi:hypothetical protein